MKTAEQINAEYVGRTDFIPVVMPTYVLLTEIKAAREEIDDYKAKLKVAEEIIRRRWRRRKLKMKKDVNCCKCGHPVGKNQLIKLDTYSVVQVKCDRCSALLSAAYEDEERKNIKIGFW